jgi:hypothetical protein
MRCHHRSVGRAVVSTPTIRIDNIHVEERGHSCVGVGYIAGLRVSVYLGTKRCDTSQRVVVDRILDHWNSTLYELYGICDHCDRYTLLGCSDDHDPETGNHYECVPAGTP